MYFLELTVKLKSLLESIRVFLYILVQLGKYK